MKCCFCDSIEESIYIESYKDRVIEYKLYECQNCSVQYWIPLKNPGSKWYEQDYRYSGINKDPEMRPNWNHKKIISYLSPRSGKVLDVGCGTGNFLFHAKENGWQTYGFDFDPQAVNAAQAVFDLENIEVNDLVQYYEAHRDKKFDLVTFFDVFEHIDNHNKFISNIRGMLVDDGYIAMSMPYRKGFSWLKPNDLPPRHLTRWDRTSIRKYLQSQGFKTIYIRRRTEGLTHILLKLRFRYGTLFSFNIVNKMKRIEREKDSIKIGNTGEKKIQLIKKIARMKDWIIFGIPTVVIWCILFFTERRYISLFVIAKKVDL